MSIAPFGDRLRFPRAIIAVYILLSAGALARAAEGADALGISPVIEHFDTSIQTSQGESLKAYKDFPAAHSAHARPLNALEIRAWERAVQAFPSRKQEHNSRIIAAFSRDRRPAISIMDPSARRSLRSALLGRLNIAFLADHLDLERSVATVVSDMDRGSYNERSVLFYNVHIGTFPVLVLIPKQAPRPLPAVLGLHGHKDDPSVFRDKNLGGILAERGFLVAIPRFRAMEAGRDEYEISLLLASRGFSLMGIRVFESLLMLQYLQHLPSVDPRRIAIMGHSGGSNVANLVVRVSSGIRAQVADLATDYQEVGCEYVPNLRGLAAKVNDASTAGMPILKAHYGLRQDQSEILGFLTEAMR